MLRPYLLQFSWILIVHVSLPLDLQDFNPHPPSPSHFDLLHGFVEENKTPERTAFGKFCVLCRKFLGGDCSGGGSSNNTDD